MQGEDQHTYQYLKLSLLFSIAAGIVFLLGILSWITHLPTFSPISFPWESMKPISAVCGFGLVILNIVQTRPGRKVAVLRFFPAIVIFFAVVSFAEWALGSGVSIGDYLFVTSGNNQENHPGRISASSSILFLITAIALLFQNTETKKVLQTQYTALLSAYGCFFLLLGSFFGADAMSLPNGVFFASTQCVIGIALLSVAILLRTNSVGIIRLFRHKSDSVRINLRLLLQTVGLLLAISWIRFKGEDVGWYDSRVGLPIMITVFIAVLVIVISRSARRILAMETTNASLVQRLESQNAQLELILTRTNDGIYALNNDLVITYANPIALGTVRKPVDEVVGFHVSTLFADPNVAAEYLKIFQRALDTQENIHSTYHNQQYNRWFTNTIFPSPEGITIFYKEVTEQKLAEIEVHQAKDHFQSLVENLNDIVIRVSPEGELSYISPGGSVHSEQIRTGLSEWLVNFLSPQNSFNRAHHAGGSISGKKAFNQVECSITSEDGATFFEVRYTPEYDAAGVHTSFMAICRDISETIKVREEKDRLNSIIHNASAMVCQADQNLLLSYINPAGRQMVGLDNDGTADDIHLSTLWSNTDVFEKIALPHALQHGTWTGESTLFNSEGNETPVMMIIIVHRDKSAQLAYLSLLAYDLSEIKKTEFALKESEKRWQFAVDGSSLGLWDWNINTNSVFYSRQWKEMLGYTEQEIGTDPNEFETRLHPDDKATVMNKLNEYFQGVQPRYDCVHRLQRKDGSYMYIRGRGMITDFNSDGSPARMIGTQSDVTLKYRQAEMLEKSKNELRSLAVHLQNIREEERLNLATIMQEEVGQQLSSLKMDFSNFEKPEQLSPKEIANKFNKAQRTLDLTIQLVRNISTDLRPSIIEDLGLVASLQSLTQDFKLRFDIRIRFSSIFENVETSPVTALCFYRVYQEALSNIARHSLATKVAVRLTISEEGELILAVRDDGVGFATGSQNSDRSFGLMEVRERMLMINGEMDIISSPGQGTLLLVKAPMTRDT